MHLKIHTVMHMLVQKNAQNDSIKCELEEVLYIVLRCTQGFTLRSTKNCNNKNKCEKKNAYAVVVSGPLGGAIKCSPEGTPEDAPKVSLSDLHKDIHKGSFEVAPKILR